MSRDDNRSTNPNNHKSRWVSQSGITGKVKPIAFKLPPSLDEIVRSLSEDDLMKLCGEKSLSGYVRKAIVNQLKADGLIPLGTEPPAEPRTRKRKKPTPAIAGQAQPIQEQN